MAPSSILTFDTRLTKDLLAAASSLKRLSPYCTELMCRLVPPLTNFRIIAYLFEDFAAVECRSRLLA